jgi:uroporphyrinogen-III decarboxylase
MLGALRCEQVDRVPCSPWFFGKTPGPPEKWGELCEMFKAWDVDGHLELFLETDPVVGVTSRFWTSDNGQILHKAFDTPSGILECAIRLIKELPVKDDIDLVSDYNPPLFVKPWIASMQDVECYKHVRPLPDEKWMTRMRELVSHARTLASAHQLPVIGQVGYGLSALSDMMGAAACIEASMDSPEVLHRYMDIEHEVNMRKIEIMLDAGVDIILRNGFYETTDYWSPSQVRDIVLSRINDETRLTHSMGGIFIYTVCTGIVPLLDMYLESDIDGLIKYETKLTGQSLKPIADKLAGKKSLWGGISDCEDLGADSPETVRQAVTDLFEYVGKRGLVVAASPSIKPYRPIENVKAMFEQWRLLRNMH